MLASKARMKNIVTRSILILCFLSISAFLSVFKVFIILGSPIACCQVLYKCYLKSDGCIQMCSTDLQTTIWPKGQETGSFATLYEDELRYDELQIQYFITEFFYQHANE